LCFPKLCHSCGAFCLSHVIRARAVPLADPSLCAGALAPTPLGSRLALLLTVAGGSLFLLPRLLTGRNGMGNISLVKVILFPCFITLLLGDLSLASHEFSHVLWGACSSWKRLAASWCAPSTCCMLLRDCTSGQIVVAGSGRPSSLPACMQLVVIGSG